MGGYELVALLLGKGWYCSPGSALSCVTSGQEPRGEGGSTLLFTGRIIQEPVKGTPPVQGRVPSCRRGSVCTYLFRLIHVCRFHHYFFKNFHYYQRDFSVSLTNVTPAILLLLYCCNNCLLYVWNVFVKAAHFMWIH